MTRQVSRACVVYGDRTGAAAFLDAPPSICLPHRIGQMIRLGSPAELVGTAIRLIRDTQQAAIAAQRKAGDLARQQRPAPQESLAVLLGASQQDVSRWLRGTAAPRLTDTQWATLIRLILLDASPADRRARRD